MKQPLLPTVLALAAGLACTSAAHAQASPYAMGVSETLEYQSNSTLSQNAQGQSSLVSTTMLNLLLDQPIGRQRLKANAELGVQRFNTTEEWNNHPYRLGAELDWSTVDRWEGELGLDTGRQLYRYDQNTADPVLNEEQSTRFWLRARVGVITTWTFETGLTAYRRNLSLASFDRLDQHQWAGEAGVRYRYSPDLGGRLMLRHADGEYPRFLTGESDEFRRNDLELSADWRPSGASLIEARVAFGRESHTQQSSRSADLWTGSLNWRWEPTGKLAFVTTLQRDSDIGASRFETVSTPTTGGSSDGSTGGTTGTTITSDQTTDARLSTTAGLGATWAATAKIQVAARASYTRRNLESDSTSTESRQGHDATTTFSLLVRYSPTRALELGCSVSRQRRSVSDSSLGLSFPYGNTTYGCSAAFWLR